MGWLVGFLGIVCLSAGVAGGVSEIYKDIRDEVISLNVTPTNTDPLADKTSIIEALTKFLEVLIQAPQWLILVIVGVGLIWWGGQMKSSGRRP